MSDYKVKPLFPASSAASNPAPKSAAEPVRETQPSAVKVRTLFAPVQEVKHEGPNQASALNLPGAFIRQRVPVDPEKLRIEYQLEEKVLKHAVEIISRINIDQISATSFTDYGAEDQQKASEFSDAMLSLAMNPVLADANRLLKHLVQQIEDYGDLWKGFFRKTESPMDLIKATADQLRLTIIRFPEIKTQLELMRQQCALAIDNACAWSVAGQYISKYMVSRAGDKTTSQVIDTIDRRVSSLLTTQLALRQGAAQLELITEQIRYQQVNVWNALENLVPAWRLQAAQTSTQSNNLKQQILGILKGK